MKKTKLFLLGLLGSVIVLSTPAFADTIPSTSSTTILQDVQNETKTTTSSGAIVHMNDSLSANDLSIIKKDINSILSSKYEIMKNNKSKDYSDIIGDSKLLELINKTNDFNIKLFSNFKTKIEKYNSNVTLKDIARTSNNTYIVNVLYDVEFQLNGINGLSQSKGEKYRFEVQYKDNKWNIIKMIDLSDESEDANAILADKVSSKILSDNYNNSIDSQIKNIDDKCENIDQYLNYFKQNNSKSTLLTANRLSSSSYQYDPDEAVSYACSYAESPNPAYRYYDGEDCTNFVSQCVNYGGIPRNPGVWMPGQYDWNTVGGFYTYMTNYGYAKGATWTNGARVGDVVQWYNPSTEQWSHSLILTGTGDDGSWVYCSHSNNRKNYPLYATYSSSTFTDMRTIEFWH